MCPPSSSSLSRRGLLTAAALGAAGRGAATTTGETTGTNSGSVPELRWSVRDDEAELVYPPTVDGGLAHAVVRYPTSSGFEEHSEGAEMHAFDVDSGETKWTKALGGFGAFHEQGGGRVYAVGTVRDDDQTTATLYALDAADGTEQWTFETGAWVRSSPVVVDETVYVTSQDNNLYALAAATGEERWAYEIGAPLVGSPAVADGTVYLGTADNALAALREA